MISLLFRSNSIAIPYQVKQALSNLPKSNRFNLAEFLFLCIFEMKLKISWNQKVSILRILLIFLVKLKRVSSLLIEIGKNRDHFPRYPSPSSVKYMWVDFASRAEPNFFDPFFDTC